MISRESLKIPQPKTYGPLGNLPQIDFHRPLQSILKLSDEYGPIFRLDMPGRSEIFISSPELVADACDSSRFDKKIWEPLQKVRAFTGDGLFTSGTDEPNWRKAHNILLPSFSQKAMQSYHAMMADIAVQLVQKWSRLNPGESIEVPEDMTRLTLDTIGLCGFDYRFNSFYRETPHPFIVSMVRALNEAMNQLQRMKWKDLLMVGTKRRYVRDIKTMASLVDRIIAERKEHGHLGADDLLSRMLNAKDPETGEGLDDENIRFQIITFLIAGHETTSGLLSFALYFLLKNPDKLQKAYEETDRVLTSPIPTYAQVRGLSYIRMVLNEALRLWPTAPAFALEAKEDTILADRYPMKKGDSVIVLLPKLHRDAGAWGEDAERFRPERFEDPGSIPRHAFKPFGNGQRACIGQQFALHEAALVLGMILKNFELIDHTNYELNIKETLTLKPEGFTIQVRPRNPIPVMLPGQESGKAPEPAGRNVKGNREEHEDEGDGEPLSVQFVSGIAGKPLGELNRGLNVLITENRELQGEFGGHRIHHIEMALPEGITYREGDHVGIFPQNAAEVVERVLRRFGLNGDEAAVLSGGGRRAGHLPLGRPVRVCDLLSGSVELQETVTRAQLRELASVTACPPHKRELEAFLQDEAYEANILRKGICMLQLLEQYPACELTFQRFLELLPPIKARIYSISSSPRVLPDRISITVNVVIGPAWNGTGEYRGVASNYLAGIRPGDSVRLFLRTPESGFRLSEDPKIPIVMAGSGICAAPFRSFLQARRVQQQEGLTIGEARLVLGIGPPCDYPYREELEQLREEGLVAVHDGCADHPLEWIRLLDQGGRLYVCGEGRGMTSAAEQALLASYRDVRGADRQEAQDWLNSLRQEGRYAKDAWDGPE